jgi:hypothetical protein
MAHGVLMLDFVLPIFAQFGNIQMQNGQLQISQEGRGNPFMFLMSLPHSIAN